MHDEDGPLPTAPPPAYHEDRAGDVDEECWASPPRRRYDPDAYYDAKAAVTSNDVENLGRGVAAALRYSTDAARQSLEATDDLRRRIAELELTVANRLEDEAHCEAFSPSSPPPAAFSVIDGEDYVGVWKHIKRATRATTALAVAVLARAVI